MTDTTTRFSVPRHEDGERLDRLVARHAGVSRRVARIWIAQGRVRIRGKIIRILSRTLHAGTDVEIAAGAQEESLPLRCQLLHLDKYVIALAKPPGLLSEPDRFGSPSVESLVPRLLMEAGERRTQVKLVHRLDAGTSGVLMLARTPMAAKNLGAAFAGGACQKVYVALCSGCFADPREVDAPIARDRGVRHAVRTDGKAAATLFEPMASHETFSLIRALPRTGRTHQIRVHLAHVGHPILGDRLYGGPGYVDDRPPAVVGRPMLHALELVVPHPKSGEPLRVTVPPPADFSDLAARLGLTQNGSIRWW